MDNKPTTSKPLSSSQEVGFVLSVRDFLVYSDGLPSIKINEIVVSETGARGWVNGLLEDRVQILMIDENNVQPGEMFKRSGKSLDLSVGQHLIGRAINPIGVPLDGKGPLKKIKADELFEIDQEASGIDKRQFITDQFITGLGVIDTLIPLGLGQRELVLGDIRSGKGRFLLDVVINQKQTGTVCVYCLIGKATTEVRAIMDELTASGALSYTVIVAASANDMAPLNYLAPHSAMTIAQYFQKLGKNVLVILDDLGIHAKVHREISLLSDKSPGRESYPGDIFYQHSHLLERAGRFTAEFGGGSITVLPAIEINLNDFTTLIPTNIMSMTDGHLLFKSALFSQGIYPSVDIDLSVSRVGRQTQNRVQNSLSSKIRNILSQAKSLETLSSFSSELPEETQIILKQKNILEEFLKQDFRTYLPLSLQTAFLGLALTNYLKFKPLDVIIRNKMVFLKGLFEAREFAQITANALKFKSDDELIAKLETVASKFDSLIK
ncbi:MAG: F0F1 ATP synthase subunit alpha [Candidatus Daviesbacteria bacterium]|nr:F0F1 ATP synthase subunit alpha [Candidatus Daviesbacteria bacterium]